MIRLLFLAFLGLMMAASTGSATAASKEPSPITILIDSNAPFEWDNWTMPNLEELLQARRLVRMCRAVDGIAHECEYAVPALPRPKTKTFYSDHLWSADNAVDAVFAHPSKDYIEIQNLGGWDVRVCSSRFGQSSANAPECKIFPAKK